jgi:hypothetical protein
LQDLTPKWIEKGMINDSDWIAIWGRKPGATSPLGGDLLTAMANSGPSGSQNPLNVAVVKYVTDASEVVGTAANEILFGPQFDRDIWLAKLGRWPVATSSKGGETVGNFGPDGSATKTERQDEP